MPKSNNEKDVMFIIGCGGTGSWFVHYLHRAKKMFGNFRFYIFDHDVVTEKNTERQNFSRFDIGKHKAFVVAKKLTKAGLEAYPVINTFAQIDVIPKMVVMAVDNMKARKFYYERIYKPFRPFWLDSGNGMLDGQIFALNGDFNTVYEHFLEHTVDEGPSCVEEEQTAFINQLMGKALFELLKKHLFGEEVPKFYFFNPETGDNLSGEVYTVYEFVLIQGFLLTRRNKRALNLIRFLELHEAADRNKSCLLSPITFLLKVDKEIFVFHDMLPFEWYLKMFVPYHKLVKLFMRYWPAIERGIEDIFCYKDFVSGNIFLDFNIPERSITASKRTIAVKKLIERGVLKRTSFKEILLSLKPHAMSISRLNISLDMMRQYIVCSSRWVRKYIENAKKSRKPLDRLPLPW